MENIKILKLMKKAEEKDGVTVTPSGEEFTADRGYMVSIINKEKTAENITEFIDLFKQYQDDAEKLHGYIGMWKYNNKWFLDISYHILDKTDALEFGKKNKQIAIYGFKENESLYIKDYNFTSYYTLYKVLRDSEYNITDIINIGGTGNREILKRLFGWSKASLEKHILNEIPTDNYDFKYVIIKDYFLKE